MHPSTRFGIRPHLHPQGHPVQQLEAHDPDNTTVNDRERHDLHDQEHLRHLVCGHMEPGFPMRRIHLDRYGFCGLLVAAWHTDMFSLRRLVGSLTPLPRSCFPRGLPAPHSTSTVSSRRRSRSLRTLRKMPPLFQTPRAPNCPDLRFSPCSVRVLHMYPAIVLRSRRPPRMSLKVSFPRSRGFVDLD